ncbi:MAG: hypothetical protein LC118_19535 [Dehalococcoidia bacterium]|nr:hypothetical protein [Dehalococcoidia bacterium]
MTPDVPKVLNALIGSLAMGVGPEVQTPFAQQTVGLGAALLFFLAQDFDRAASRLVEENAAMLELLSRARVILSDPVLQDRIAELEKRTPGSDLHVSALQRENDDLKRALIDVHAAVETLPGDEAATLNQAIWDELRDSTKRRHIENMLG